MTKTITMALVATLGLGLAFGACAAEKTLAEVHGGQLPAETGWATKGQCLQCHQSYDALAEKTKNLEPNPHKSHLGAVNCVECHKADKPSKQPELMCNSCNNFTLRRNNLLLNHQVLPPDAPCGVRPGNQTDRKAVLRPRPLRPRAFFVQIRERRYSRTGKKARLDASPLRSS